MFKNKTINQKQLQKSIKQLKQFPTNTKQGNTNRKKNKFNKTNKTISNIPIPLMKSVKANK